MVLKALLDVQLALLHTEVNRVNLLLHRRNSQLHRAYAPPCRDANAVNI